MPEIMSETSETSETSEQTKFNFDLIEELNTLSDLSKNAILGKAYYHFGLFFMNKNTDKGMEILAQLSMFVKFYDALNVSEDSEFTNLMYTEYKIFSESPKFLSLMGENHESVLQYFEECWIGH